MKSLTLSQADSLAALLFALDPTYRFVQLDHTQATILWQKDVVPEPSKDFYTNEAVGLVQDKVCLPDLAYLLAYCRGGGVREWSEAVGGCCFKGLGFEMVAGYFYLLGARMGLGWLGLSGAEEEKVG